MSLELLCVWIVIGMIAAWVAAAAVGGPFGLFGDIIVAVLGASVGGLMFKAFDIETPFGDIGGVIFTAFVGAFLLLVALRATLGSRGRRALLRS